MTHGDKEKVSITMAVVLLVSGVTMCFCAFFMDEKHEINSSVLWYFGQTLIYAASVFGVMSYLDYRLNKNN